MQFAKNVIFQARMREDEPAVATTSMVASYRTLAKSVGNATKRLADLKLGDAKMVVIDVAQPMHHLYLMIALALSGVPSTSLSASRDPLPASGPKPALVLADADRSDTGVPTVRIDGDWFASDPAAPPDYAGMLGLPDIPGDKIVRYVFSSGTTGRRKCVGFTAERMGASVAGQPLSQMNRTSMAGGMLSIMDFSTSPGSSAPYRTLSRGGFLCLAHNPAAAIDLIRLFRLESMNVSVGQAQAILELLRGQRPLSSLREVRLSGARMPLRLLAEARAKLCPEITFSYASTEMGLVAMGTGGVIERQEGIVGYVMPGVAIEIVDDAGNRVAPGVDGNLRVIPTRDSHYIDDHGERMNVLNEGWFYPGDIARLSAGGLLTIVGRAGDVINRGGVVIAPEVVEEAFARDPRIREVAAVGVPGARGLDEIWLAVVTDDSVDLEALRTSIAASLRETAPDRAFRVVSIPRGAGLKVQRFKLREELQALAAKK